MAQDGVRQQGFHAALIRGGFRGDNLKHFPRVRFEMLQEIRLPCVDLLRNQP
jgi:hypothetical protein